MRSIDFERLFWLHDGHKRGALHARPRRRFLDPFAVLCGAEPLPQPLECEQFLGRTPYDLIGTGWAVLYLVSNRVVDALHQEGATGWRAEPAEVYLKGGQAIPGYHLPV